MMSEPPESPRGEFAKMLAEMNARKREQLDEQMQQQYEAHERQLADNKAFREFKAAVNRGLTSLATGSTATVPEERLRSLFDNGVSSDDAIKQVRHSQ